MEIFFRSLAERVNNENSLSDITWSLCNSNAHFQKIFLDYCFGNEITNDIETIEREFAKDNSRPDFLITDVEGKKYLLEVKKYDKNLHKEYKYKFKDAIMSIITNYNIINKNIGYKHYKTWHGFINHLNENIKSNDNLNVPLVNGYLVYLKYVTNYFEGANMNLSGLHSVYTFLNTIKAIVEEHYPEIKCKYSARDDYSGVCITFKKETSLYYIWYGVTYGEETTYIVIEFTNDCLESIKSKLLDIDEGKYFKKPYKDKESVMFEISDVYYKQLCNNDIEYTKQKEIIKSFFMEISGAYPKVCVIGRSVVEIPKEQIWPREKKERKINGIGYWSRSTSMA